MSDNGVVRCELCRYPGGELYCSNHIACNFRCRRRLGMPLHACITARARDYRERAREQDRLAHEQERIAEAVRLREPLERDPAYIAFIRSAEWATFADEQRLHAHYRCEDCCDVHFALHVHHLSYAHLREGRMPRPDEVLVLCANCHRDWDLTRRHGVEMAVRVTVDWHSRRVRIEPAKPTSVGAAAPAEGAQT